MNKKWKRDDLIVRSLADSYLPIALVLGFYVILHGNISPGGGFQGGVLAASGVLLLYLGYGFRGIATAINMERMHRLEAVGAIAYVLFAMLGIFAGYNFCRNILWNSGSIGDLWSSGTIALMNYAVGFKVLTGVGFLLLLVIYLLGMDEDHEFDGTIPTTEQEEGGLLANYIGAVALVVIGFYAMAMKRDIIKIVVGMGLVDYGLNLMIVSIGFNEGGTAPIYTFGELTSGMYFVDPIPQALTLTSIVIGACVTAMALALCVRLYKEYGTLDAHEIRRLHG